MNKPVVHQETWGLVRRLATDWGEPEWKVMHLAVTLLNRTAQTAPEVVESFRAMEGELYVPHAAIPHRPLC